MRDGNTVQVRWGYVGIFALMHLLAIAALLPWFFSISGLLICVIGCWVTGGLGITLGFHRLLTHRSYTTYKPIEYFLTLCGCLSWQGSPMTWVGTHRLHHSESDTPLDPHSPRDGFGWSHVFWMLYTDRPQQEPLKYTRDMQRDPGLRLIEKWWWLPQVISIPVLVAGGWAWSGSWLGGASWLLWGFGARTVWMYHGTWFVNSASHAWGYRNFDTEDDSRNNWWVALLSFGEGWHNNHHAQQRSAAHGMRWFEFDLTYLTILAMRGTGLAWDIVAPRRPERRKKPAAEHAHHPHAPLLLDPAALSETAAKIVGTEREPA